MTTYSGYITQLDANEVFVFGSNPIGINGGGAARVASDNGWCLRNEKMNNCFSHNKKSYGLVTVQGPGQPRSKTPSQIKRNIETLYGVAFKNPHMTFYVAYTGTNTFNLNGYSNEELAEMFASHHIPVNIVFEEEFYELVKSKGGSC